MIQIRLMNRKKIIEIQTKMGITKIKRITRFLIRKPMILEWL